MAVGYTLKTVGIEEANDSKLYIGVQSFALSGDSHTINITGISSTSNFGTGAVIDLQKVKTVVIAHSQLYSTDTTYGDRTPGT